MPLCSSEIAFAKCDFALVSFNLTLGCRRCRQRRWRRSLATLGLQTGLCTISIRSFVLSPATVAAITQHPYPQSLPPREIRKNITRHIKSAVKFFTMSKTIHHTAHATYSGSNWDCSYCCGATCRDLLLLQCQQPSVKLELACRVRLVECGVCKHCPILLRCKLLKRTRANFCSARLADCATHLCSHLETTHRDKNTNSSRLSLVSVSGSPLCNYGTL